MLSDNAKKTINTGMISSKFCFVTRISLLYYSIPIKTLKIRKLNIETLFHTVINNTIKSEEF